jgi:hypothetical protein
MSSPAPSDPVPIDRNEVSRPPADVDAAEMVVVNANDNSGEFQDDVVVLEEELTATGRGTMRDRGRPTSTVWEQFTNDLNPFKLKSAVCKHCKTLINHHKKGESAKVHLNKCRAFRRLMNGLGIEDRPIWYEGNKKWGPRSNVGKAFGSSSGSMKDQSSIKNYLLPAVSAKEKAAFQTHIALHYYATGTPFQRVEDGHLARAIAMLRPDGNLLPDRRKLASGLLDKCYCDIKSRVDARMSKSIACITTEGWTNIKNDPVVNYMATSSNFCFFLESVSTGQQGHNAVWIAADIERVISAYSHTSIAGAVTDNTNANKKAWAILSVKFPTCYFQGRCSHGLHLLVKDIFAATKTKKRGKIEETYPNGYPFENMLEFVRGC